MRGMTTATCGLRTRMTKASVQLMLWRTILYRYWSSSEAVRVKEPLRRTNSNTSPPTTAAKMRRHIPNVPLFLRGSEPAASEILGTGPRRSPQPIWYAPCPSQKLRILQGFSIRSAQPRRGGLVTDHRALSLSEGFTFGAWGLSPRRRPFRNPRTLPYFLSHVLSAVFGFNQPPVYPLNT